MCERLEVFPISYDETILVEYLESPAGATTLSMAPIGTDAINPCLSAPLHPSESRIQDNKALTYLTELDAATMKVVSADALLDSNVFKTGAMGQAREEQYLKGDVRAYSQESREEKGCRRRR